MDQQHDSPISAPARARGSITADAPAPSAAGAEQSINAASSGRPYHLFADVLRGIFLGAYGVEEMRTPGLLVWIIVGFVPGLGTLAAARDAYYCLEVREWGGLVFNLIGFVPFMKGFATIAEVSRLHQLHRAAHTTHQVVRVARHGRMARTGSRRAAAAVTGLTHEAGAVMIFLGRRVALSRNSAAWPALLLAFVAVLLFPMALGLVIIIVTSDTSVAGAISPAMALGSGTVALLCSLGILLLAAYARRAAVALQGRSFSRGVVATLALWLAWFGFLLTVTLAAVIVYVEHGIFSRL